MVIYTALNAFAVLIPFIPGPETFIAWAFVLPLIVVVSIWIWLVRARQAFLEWWILGLVLSFWHLGLALVTFLVITSMWAAV